MLESAIVARIMKKVLDKLDHAFFFKVHGSVFQRVGIPDILGCYYGRFVAIEVKQPGNMPTDRQAETMRRLKAAGAYVILATCEDDVVKLIARIDQDRAAA